MIGVRWNIWVIYQLGGCIPHHLRPVLLARSRLWIRRWRKLRDGRRLLICVNQDEQLAAPVDNAVPLRLSTREPFFMSCRCFRAFHDIAIHQHKCTRCLQRVHAGHVRLFTNPVQCRTVNSRIPFSACVPDGLDSPDYTVVISRIEWLRRVVQA